MNVENPRSADDSVVDLAREADFRLGALRVSPSIREVEHGGQREALEPRVMQVLVVLHQAEGGVISRDELIARCWEGRIVGEDAVSRAIWRLRKLAEADGYANFTIETIPRVGYRLLTGDPVALAKAAMSETPSVSESENQPPASSIIVPAGSKTFHWGRWRLAAGLALLGVVSCALAAWLLWPARHWTVESGRPFISSLALEGEPAFSPDGRMLAYTSGATPLTRNIYVRNVAGGDGIKITGDAYDDVSPSWSSDGARLAYVAQKTGEPCRIVVAGVPVGEVRQAGRCAQSEFSSVTWQPGTSFLYYMDTLGGKRVVFRLDLDSGAKRLIVPGGCLCDQHASPDGRSLAYLRMEQKRIAIVFRDLAGGREKILGWIAPTATAAWSDSLAWSEDSRALLASAANGTGTEIIAFPVDGGTPYRVYASAMGISHLSAGGGGLLAVETDASRKNLARASVSPILQPDIIDPANGLTTSPTFAPDGTMAFLSNRSGSNAVWIMKPGAAPVQLWDAGLLPLYRENFSPDGTRLAVVYNAKIGVTVKILTADGASVATLDLPTMSNGMPTWTPDGTGLVVYDAGLQRAVRIDIDNPARRTPVAAPLWQAVIIRADGTFATRDDKPGLWRIDHGTRLLSAKYPTNFSPPIAFRGDDVLIPDFNAEGGARILAQPLAGGPDRVIAYAPGAEDRLYRSKMAVNPKTGEIIYVASVLRDTNIDLLTLAKR